MTLEHNSGPIAIARPQTERSSLLILPSEQPRPPRRYSSTYSASRITVAALQHNSNDVQLLPNPNLPRTPSSKGIDDAMFRVKTLVLILIGFFVGWVLREASILTSQEGIHPLVQQRIRHSWDRDYREHQTQAAKMQAMTSKWSLEIQSHEAARMAMQREREEWENERRERAMLLQLDRQIDGSRHDVGSHLD
ncbi:hypothetical protein FA15DRAFT_671473 [Coprinopsis marcescibilis]|uniref:Uncharacterized protein n=1 Tax=Coprinopsis marcescibilis TaxID=230819 RepID=A0A5C3KQ90_COPMA|nr:hypothetical protein FA15DRAFT_671473 [Coprinopsis marcescibilis]